jgi:hypothetical protein
MSDRFLDAPRVLAVFPVHFVRFAELARPSFAVVFPSQIGFHYTSKGELSRSQPAGSMVAFQSYSIRNKAFPDLEQNQKSVDERFCSGDF